MISHINNAEIRPFYEESSVNSAFTWQGQPGYNGFEQISPTDSVEPVQSDVNDEADNSTEVNYPYRVLLPLVVDGPDIVCWEQTNGEYDSDRTILYTIRFKDQSMTDQENASVSSKYSNLKLPSIPVKMYAWVQGIPFEFKGEVEICKIFPLPPRDSFLIDGNDATKINDITNGFTFELPKSLVDYRFEPDNSIFFEFEYEGDQADGGSKTIFLIPDANNPDYKPYWFFFRNTYGQGFPWVRILKDRPLKVNLKNMYPEEDGYLYIDGKRVKIDPPTEN